VRYSQVTHYAVTSGAWSDPNTWHDGVVPGNNARVLIPIGVNVTVDRVIPARLATVRVDGTLAFSTMMNTELRVDTIVVSGSGRFEMGTAAAPIPASITAKLLFTDSGPIDRTVDPFAVGRGLISHGSVSMHGAAVTAHVAVEGAVLAGSNRLTLTSVPTGWNVGDEIVLASTVAGAEQNEVRRIVGIGTKMIILDRPFNFDHVPTTSDLQVHVANLTRNVVVTSETSAVDRRGHVMFMHNRDVHIENTGFYQLGRTDKSVPINDPVVDENWQLVAGTGTNPRGRYAVHFHRNGLTNDGNPSTISGSAVVDSPGWGFVNHSSYVDMSDNVAYDALGAGFATEVGDEIGSFRNNISVGATGSSEAINARISIQDFGHTGDGFWFQGAGVEVTGNISAGNEGAAFQFYTRGLVEGGVLRQFLAANLPDPSIAGGATTIDVGSVPIYLFSGNVGYASRVGLATRYHLRDSTHSLAGTFRDSQFWNNSLGVDLSYAWRTVLRNLTIVSSPDDLVGVGVESNPVTRDIRYENLTVTGYDRGVVLPRQGYAVVDGGRYHNRTDFSIQTAVSGDRMVLLTGAIELSRVAMTTRFEPISGSVAHVFLQDRVLFNFGQFQNQRIYYSVQAPSAVPFPVAEPGVPAAYVGLTSQQLWNQFGLAVGGTLAPVGAISLPEISGLIGPPT
jgi:hypothetical protein